MKRRVGLIGAVLVAAVGCGGTGGTDSASPTSDAMVATPGVEVTASEPPATASTSPSANSAPESTTAPSSSAPPTSATPTSAPAPVDAATLEAAAVGLSLLEQQNPSAEGEMVDLADCVLADQATIDDAYGAIGQPQPFAPLTASVLVYSSEVAGSTMRSFQVACVAVASEGVTAPTSEVTLAVATKRSDATLRDLITDSDPHTITNESPEGEVLGSSHLGYCYDYDTNSYCFQSFDYGPFAVILKHETPAGEYDPSALSTAAQSVVPVVLQRLGSVAGG
jgi:hypothetical protein